jgi:hypothetical protein
MLTIACLLLFGRLGVSTHERPLLAAARCAATGGCGQGAWRGCGQYIIANLEGKQVGESPELCKKGAIAQSGF